ncbi:YdbC family protein [Amphibacillus sediminis]|uniref:YdbC family protein n=1 Tax=Amphibacillus sediminis TaxID=360185 RepID=UPI00082CAA9C|nr:PC4/YdbC family ssDNA-binding protein [Amphibacillus sediminis]
MADLNYQIIKTIGILSEAKSGWTRELNLISWNNRQPKYDLRDWAPNHEKMGKGITLSEAELSKLVELINKMDTNI